jgi:hypothetical protein
MTIEENDKDQMVDFNFSQEIENSVEAPVFKEDKDRSKDIVPYTDKEGKNYPDKLLYDYNNCALHNAIITSKVFQVMGKGFTYDLNGPNAAATTEFFGCVNDKKEDINEVATKCVGDMEIFGAFA